MNLRFKLFGLGLCVCLIGMMTASPIMAARVSCKDWNTREFFEYGTEADVSRCLEAGADPMALNEEFERPLYYAAAWNEDPAVITTLLNAGAKVNATNARDWNQSVGFTALHYAADYNDNPAIITTLVKAGAKVNQIAPGLQTPLYRAADTDNVEVVMALLVAGADVNMGSAWDTALHEAVTSYSADAPAVISLLLAAGADPNALDREGRTPRQLVQLKHFPDIDEIPDGEARMAAFSPQRVAVYREKLRKAKDAASKRGTDQRVQVAKISCDRWNTGAFFRHARAAEVTGCLKTEDPLLFRTLIDAGSPRLFDVIAARISQIVRSFPDRSVGDHGLCGRFELAV